MGTKEFDEIFIRDFKSPSEVEKYIANHKDENWRITEEFSDFFEDEVLYINDINQVICLSDGDYIHLYRNLDKFLSFCGYGETPSNPLGYCFKHYVEFPSNISLLASDACKLIGIKFDGVIDVSHLSKADKWISKRLSRGDYDSLISQNAFCLMIVLLGEAVRNFLDKDAMWKVKVVDDPVNESGKVYPAVIMSAGNEYDVSIGLIKQLYDPEYGISGILQSEFELLVTT